MFVGHKCVWNSGRMKGNSKGAMWDPRRLKRCVGESEEEGKGER